MIPLGSIVNAIAVIIGSILGLTFRANLSEKIRKTIFQVMGLFTLAIGMKMCLETNQFIVLLFTLILGALIGEKINIEEKLESLGTKVKIILKNKNENFSEGLVTSFLLYCIGSMTFIGTIEEGINQDRTLLYTKSFMDGISSILLASNFGISILFSAFPLLIFQSILTLGAIYLEPHLTTEMITEISALGGVLIFGLGINILEIKKINVNNMLPSLFLVIPIYLIFS